MRSSNQLSNRIIPSDTNQYNNYNKQTTITAAMYKIVIITFFALFALVHAGGDPADVQAIILKYENELKPKGSYNYAYETSNRIQAEESGVGSSYAAGSYSYISPEGQPIQLSYTADENGYQPKGDHLPTPPPIPDYILRALAYIESHPFPKAEQLLKKKRSD